MSTKAESKLFGVCAYIANKYNIDVFLVRCLTLGLALMSMGVTALIYFLMGIFVVEDN